jgi:hypothetical protein
MSQMGQSRKSPLAQVTSALPPKSGMLSAIEACNKRTIRQSIVMEH